MPCCDSPGLILLLNEKRPARGDKMHVSSFSLVCMVCLISTGFPTITGAETAYVIDRLLIGIHQAKTLDSPILKVIPTGTELEVLERDEELAQVREPTGTVGWVDAGYLMTEQPAVLVVDAFDRQNKELASQIRALRTGRGGDRTPSDERLAKENVELREQLSSERLKAADLQAKLGHLQSVTGDMTSGAYVKRLEVENAELKTTLMREGREPDREFALFATSNLPGDNNNILWTLIVLVLAFGGGVFFMDYLNRRRHGGFRV